MLATAVLTGWWVGYVLAVVIITVVVGLVAAILTLAGRIGRQAQAITDALDDARLNTLGLWDVEKANAGLRSMVKGAQQARAVLEGGR